MLHSAHASSLVLLAGRESYMKPSPWMGEGLGGGAAAAIDRPLDRWIQRCPDSTLRGRASGKGRMKIATWNVNSVKVRLPHLMDFLKNAQPDVLCLQEIKCLADDFPRLEVAGLGYKVEALGQRAYNGVALLSKEPARDIVLGLPGDDGDDHARYIEASFGPAHTGARIASIYLP